MEQHGVAEVRTGSRKVARSIGARGADIGLSDLQLAVATLGGMKGRRRAQAERTLLGLL
jgi:hypothetical protein